MTKKAIWSQGKHVGQTIILGRFKEEQIDILTRAFVSVS
jgi:hypothetical protein